MISTLSAKGFIFDHHEKYPILTLLIVAVIVLIIVLESFCSHLLKERAEKVEIMNKNEGKPSDEWSEEERKKFDKAIDSAEYGKCVEISTQSAIKEMVAPGLVAILTPVAIGFGGGAVMLGGLLAGVTASGVLMALFQSNAGGAWDNAKKMVEEGYEIDGVTHAKGSEVHKATVVGDTVGDPLKDTSGPSLNILLKLMSVVALVMAPFIKV